MDTHESKEHEGGGFWCCEWCDQAIDHLQEQIWQLHRQGVEREEVWKNRYQQLELNQRRIFQKVAEFESIFVSQVGMAENLAGVYDVVENTNTRIVHLTNEVQGPLPDFIRSSWMRYKKGSLP